MQAHHILIGLAILVAGIAIGIALAIWAVYSLRDVELTPDEPDAFK